MVRVGGVEAIGAERNNGLSEVDFTDGKNRTKGGRVRGLIFKDGGEGS